MSLLKQIWNDVKGILQLPVTPDDDGNEFMNVPNAQTFQEMQSAEEAVWPLPEAAPVVATASDIRINKPLRLKTVSHVRPV